MAKVQTLSFNTNVSLKKLFFIIDYQDSKLWPDSLEENNGFQTLLEQKAQTKDWKSNLKEIL